MSKKSAKRKIKQIKLKENEVLKVTVPSGQTPVVATDPDKDEVHVAPTPKQSWVEFLFGTSTRKD